MSPFWIISIASAILYSLLYLFLRGIGIVNERANCEEEYREAERDILSPYAKVLEFDLKREEAKWRMR